MPYPALNLNGSLQGPSVYKTNTNPSGVVSSTAWKNMREKHPASTNNPVRRNGTRRMAAWQHEGSRCETSTTGYARIAKSGGPQWSEFSGCAPAQNVDPTKLVVWTGARDYTLLKAMASWADRQVEFSDFLRTAGSTAKMVGDLGHGLAKELTNDSRFSPGVARHWRKLPGWYLQYLYGWKPLADDISKATDRLIKEIQLNHTLDFCLKAGWKARKELTLRTGGGTWAGWAGWRHDLLLEQKNRTVMRYRIPTDRLENLQPQGFFGGVWEARPYSFVLDWVLPVGTWLRALDANALAYYFVEGCSSESVRTIRVRDQFDGHKSVPSGWNVTCRNLASRFTQKPFRFERRLQTPYANLTARVPLRTDLNLNHAAQGIALLTQVLRR